jgi:hypothetical protein
MVMRATFVLCAVFAVVCASARAVDEIPYEEGSKPPAAAPGEKWCVVLIPETYKTVTESVMVEACSVRYERVPAVLEKRQQRVQTKCESCKCVLHEPEWKDETYQVCVTPATCRYEKVPAVYEDREESVLVQEGYSRQVQVAATFRTEEIQIQVAPERTEWQQIAANEKAKDGHLECWQMVKIPAKVETVKRQVIDKPAHCECEKVPAKYETIKKKVCVQPECEKKIEVPAVHETRTKHVLCKDAYVTYEKIPEEWTTVEKVCEVQPECLKKIEVPARYETKSHEVVDRLAHKVWRKVGTAEGTSDAKVIEGKPIDKDIVCKDQPSSSDCPHKSRCEDCYQHWLDDQEKDYGYKAPKPKKD